MTFVRVGGLYTMRAVRRFIPHLSLVVVLVVAGLPAARLACQWVCAPAAGPGHQHHHSHAPAESQPGNAGAAAINGVGADCEHVDGTAVGFANVAFKLDPEVTQTELLTAAAHGLGAVPAIILAATHTPPGASSPPLVLRL